MGMELVLPVFVFKKKGLGNLKCLPDDGTWWKEDLQVMLKEDMNVGSKVSWRELIQQLEEKSENH